MYNPDEECRRIIQRLRRLCEIRGISGKALSAEAGLSVATVNNLIGGKTTPQMHTLYKLCNVFGISMEELLSAGILDEEQRAEAAAANDPAARAYQRLSDDERNLVALFRYLPERKRRMMRIYMEMLILIDNEKLAEG